MITPKFYYCRHGVSDRDWIAKMMTQIPDGKRKEVSDKYDNIYLSSKNPRREANTYLHGVAKEFHSNRTKTVD